MRRVLVTGAAGYIGGQTMLALRDAGYWIMAVDRRPLPEHLRRVPDTTVMRDFSDSAALSAIGRNQIDAVVHCAGTSLVGPSITTPEDYYDNNFVKTKLLADYLVTSVPQCRLIFSSSASVYGEPVFTPCAETDPIMPISPYGQSKAMIEWMLQAYRAAYNLDYVSFRYFNAAGADPQARHGQEPGATHIIARVLESLRDNREFSLYGTGFDTADGTCVRDYIHVADLAGAHVRATDPNTPPGAYNLGIGHGHSNRTIINQAQDITGRTLWVTEHAARAGDPAVLTADSSLWQRVSGWQPQHCLQDIINHAWRWYLREF